MATYYVRSGAGGTADGSSWANAYLTLAAAFSGKAAGDTFYVSEDHAETQASAITLLPPGTAASPNRVLCVDHAGSVPPVSADLRTTATVSTTGNSNISFTGGVAYYYGITFNCGSGGNNTSISLLNGAAGWARFDSCKLAVVATGSTASINLSNSAGNPANAVVELWNTPLSFGAAGQTVNVGNLKLTWSNTASAVAGTAPTTLFNFQGSAISELRLTGVDLSALGSGKTLFAVGAAAHSRAFCLDCKLGASVAITSGSVSGQNGCVVELVDCDSTNTNYRYYRQSYQGTEQQETTIVRSGGASDGTTRVSRKIVTTANVSWFAPYESEWVVVWGDTTGGQVTITIPVLTDNVTLTTADVWPEVEALTTSGFPLGTLTGGGTADVLASGSNWATDSTSTWTTTGLGTPVRQSLTVSFTPQLKGPVRVRLKVAKPTLTMYFDPLAQVA